MKKYLINLLGYLGVGFIGGAISHGFFSGTRSFIMAGIGIILFLISEFLKEGDKDYVNTIIFGLFYSLCVGMVSGGFQHFLDGPERAILIIPIGFVLGYIIFVLRDKENKLSTNNIFIVLAIGLGLFLIGSAAYKYIPANLYSELADHHGGDNHGKGADKKTINNEGNNLHGDNVDKKYSDLGYSWMAGKKDADILEHCQMMPSMEGCDKIVKSGNNNLNNNVSGMNNGNSAHMGNHEMNHADMVNSEFEFIYLMIPHHQEAVDTSELLLKSNPSPEVKTIAENIISGQKIEIDLMNGRLKKRYSGSIYSGMGYMLMMRNTSGINAITTIEKMWLEDMIKHHQGALDMANKLLQIMDKQDPLIKLTEEGSNFRKELRKFANDVILLQTKEINDMKNILEHGSDHHH